MWKQIVCVSLLLGGLALPAATVQLKDKASISGTILAVKSDEIVIDIGYTVLVIPRSQILQLLTDEVPATSSAAPAPPVAALPEPAVAPPLAAPPRPGAASGRGFYAIGAGLLKEHTVRELAAELGAAVVQVRTPAGLGSGFFINEDGFLITNFHVTEGETQISVEVFQQKNGELERKVYKQVKIVSLNKFGDLALLKAREMRLHRREPNAGRTNAMEFTLSGLDGKSLAMARQPLDLPRFDLKPVTPELELGHFRCGADAWVASRGIGQ